MSALPPYGDIMQLRDYLLLQLQTIMPRQVLVPVLSLQQEDVAPMNRKQDLMHERPMPCSK